jgi:glycosyltransferase involved in cell wall biosynthesis
MRIDMQVLRREMLREEGLEQAWRATDSQTRTGLAVGRSGRQAHVAILLCTMQGNGYLRGQLESILAQSHASWSIWASDDGSDDGTKELLGEYEARLGRSRLSVAQGPSEGFAKNFLSLTCNASIVADYYAYADQDDIWETNKLARALEWLEKIPSHLPALYCARTRIVDANNMEVGFSPLYTRPPHFTNALVQSIAGGNTMVFNQAACNLLRLAGADVPVVSHDWWAYLVVSGCGGKIFYDPRPTVRYRQHDGNLVGTNSRFVQRLIRTFQGRFKGWNETNIAALQNVRWRLTPDNQRRLEEFSKARDSGLFSRLAGMKRSGVRRQSVLGNIGLTAAAILGKV